MVLTLTFTSANLASPVPSVNIFRWFLGNDSTFNNKHTWQLLELPRPTTCGFADDLLVPEGPKGVG